MSPIVRATARTSLDLDQARVRTASGPTSADLEGRSARPAVQSVNQPNHSIDAIRHRQLFWKPATPPASAGAGHYLILSSAREHATNVLLDQRRFVLEPEAFDAFERALDNPPASAKAALQRWLTRVPRWEK